MKQAAFRAVLCNGATLSTGRAGRSPLRLDYREGNDPNIRISLPDFVRDVYFLPDRVLDLLEIASYVFAADRLIPRGRRAALEYESWGRSIHFAIKVRDI